MVKKHDIDTAANGRWSVYICDNGECMVVDASGRARGFFRDHTSTAIHLAICMAERLFIPHASADQALVESAQEWLKDHDFANG